MILAGGQSVANNLGQLKPESVSYQLAREYLAKRSGRFRYFGTGRFDGVVVAQVDDDVTLDAFAAMAPAPSTPPRAPRPSLSAQSSNKFLQALIPNLESAIPTWSPKRKRAVQTLVNEAAVSSGVGRHRLNNLCTGVSSRRLRMRLLRGAPMEFIGRPLRAWDL